MGKVHFLLSVELEMLLLNRAECRRQIQTAPVHPRKMDWSLYMLCGVSMRTVLFICYCIKKMLGMDYCGLGMSRLMNSRNML